MVMPNLQPTKRDIESIRRARAARFLCPHCLVPGRHAYNCPLDYDGEDYEGALEWYSLTYDAEDRRMYKAWGMESGTTHYDHCLESLKKFLDVETEF